MTIKIVCPSHMTKRLIRRKSEQYQKNNHDDQKIKGQGKILLIANSMVLIQEYGLLVNFESDDENTVEGLREFVSYLFYGTIIGVNIQNPVTKSLDGVRELLLRG